MLRMHQTAFPTPFTRQTGPDVPTGFGTGGVDAKVRRRGVPVKVSGLSGPLHINTLIFRKINEAWTFLSKPHLTCKDRSFSNLSRKNDARDYSATTLNLKVPLIPL